MKCRFMLKSKRKIGFVIVVTFTANVVILYTSLSFLSSGEQSYSHHKGLTKYEEQKLANNIEATFKGSDMEKHQRNGLRNFKSKMFSNSEGQMDFIPPNRSKFSRNGNDKSVLIPIKRMGSGKNYTLENDKVRDKNSDKQHNIPPTNGLQERADNKHVLEEINAFANKKNVKVYHMYDDNVPVDTRTKTENHVENNDDRQGVPKTFDENYIKYFWSHPEFRKQKNNLKVESKDKRDLQQFHSKTKDTKNKNAHSNYKHEVRNALYENPTKSDERNIVKHVNADQHKTETYVTMYPAKGKLGNQMFQLASLLGIANRGSFTPFLQLSQFELGQVFRFPQTLSRTIDISRFKMFTEGNYTQDISLKLCQNLNRHQNWSLDGWFQSFKYFNTVSEQVRHYFRFKKHLLQTAREFLQRTVPHGHVSVAIHVRRGDFISAYEMKLGRVEVPSEYFQKAMAYFQSKFNNITFVVVSDDIRWCKENIKGDNVVYSTFYHNEKGVDLALISHCDHVIVSVGTFGWWGGWLSKGTVIYYNKFPTPRSALDKTFVPRNYYPSSWIPLK